jgi:hypothetical protein
MQSKRENIEVAVDVPEVTIRCTQWGDMMVESGLGKQTIDAAPLFTGLPGDKCQCPHYGYVIKGELRYHFADHIETYKAGDVYYAAAGHTPEIVEGVEYVEFSPVGPYAQTMEVVGKNMEAMMAAGH